MIIWTVLGKWFSIWTFGSARFVPEEYHTRAQIKVCGTCNRSSFSFLFSVSFLVAFGCDFLSISGCHFQELLRLFPPFHRRFFGSRFGSWWFGEHFPSLGLQKTFCSEENRCYSTISVNRLRHRGHRPKMQKTWKEQNFLGCQARVEVRHEFKVFDKNQPHPIRTAW